MRHNLEPLCLGMVLIWKKTAKIAPKLEGGKALVPIVRESGVISQTALIFSDKGSMNLSYVRLLTHEQGRDATGQASRQRGIEPMAGSLPRDGQEIVGGLAWRGRIRNHFG